MTNEEINNITRRLKNLQIRSDNAIWALSEVNKEEAIIIQQVNSARYSNAAQQQNAHRIGDIVWITNRLRNKDGITGVVILSPLHLVTICNQHTGN